MTAITSFNCHFRRHRVQLPFTNHMRLESRARSLKTNKLVAASRFPTGENSFECSKFRFLLRVFPHSRLFTRRVQHRARKDHCWRLVRKANYQSELRSPNGVMRKVRSLWSLWYFLHRQRGFNHATGLYADYPLTGKQDLSPATK